MGQDDTDWKRAAKEVPELRFLKMLVTGLTIVMGLGMVTVVALLWIRLNQPVLPDLPGSIALPEGARPAAITFAADRIVVVTEADEVLVYDRAGGLIGQLQLQP
ncbi:hypothetical protein FA743_01075 [Paracoccus gahaiensis]|uniref:Uncharacterized protein n=1 Tax=Paracoccus gahaiensis TaxID=1706839 RepID=A0A4U0RFE7_9RHOB|nr:DUF6476 family protein [Paracoccus gahaiensis]TJZ93897.1 hypothetical protein FA743_01075 [Paracoccus gahaiensis]